MLSAEWFETALNIGLLNSSSEYGITDIGLTFGVGA